MFKKIVMSGIVSAGVIAASAMILHSTQDSLIYLPNHPSVDLKRPECNPIGYRDPGERNIPFEDVYFTAKDGVRLHAWLLKQKELDAPTVLFFHGNAGNMGMRMDNLEEIYRKVKANVFILSYRGYGRSEGVPSEKGLEYDAQATLEYLRNSNIDLGKVFIFGRSLGGAVAILVAFKFSRILKVRGLILENTFTSMGKIVDHVLPGSKYFKWFILRNYWPSEERIGLIDAPILFVSGGRDRLIPPSHMVELRDKAKLAKFVEWKLVENGDHNDTWEKAGNLYVIWIRQFIDRSLSLEKI